MNLIEIDLSEGGVPPSVLSRVFESWQLVKEILAPSLVCHPGRPAFDIPCSCIENLMELKFTSGEIASKYNLYTHGTVWTLILKKLLLR